MISKLDLSNYFHIFFIFEILKAFLITMCDLKYKESILRSSFDVNIFARFIIFQKDGHLLY